MPSVDAGSSGRSIRSVAMDKSDTQSLFSIRSTISTASFATFRKFGKSTKSLFRRNKNGRRDSDCEDDDDYYNASAGTSKIPSTSAAAAAAATARHASRLENIDDEYNSPRFYRQQQQSASSSSDVSYASDDEEGAITAVEADTEDSNIVVDFKDIALPVSGQSSRSGSRSATATATPSPVKTSNNVPSVISGSTGSGAESMMSEATITLESEQAEGRGNVPFSAELVATTGEPPKTQTPQISVTSPLASDDDEQSKTSYFDAKHLASEPAPAASRDHNRSDSTDSEDIAPAGDTVFPKTLDVETVETIRFSLERAKSLERRKSSKRSIRRGSTGNNATSKAQQQEEEETGVPNATEIHVTQQPDTASIISAEAPVRGILKHGDSRPDSISSLSNSITSSPRNLGDWSMSKRNSSNSNNLDDVASVVASLLEFASEPQLSLDFDFDKKFNTSTLPSTTAKASTTSTPTITTPTADTLPQRPSSAQANYPSQPPVQQQSQLDSSRPQSPSRSPSAPTWGSMDSTVYGSTNATQPQPQQQQPVPASVYQRRMSLHNRSSSFGSQVSYNHHQQSYHPVGAPPSSIGGGGGRQRQLSQPINIMRSPDTTSSKSGVSFSSRIVVYDTYGRADYDRRPEIATCNRLTPLLAQQIKEELNKFKREMEVHVESRGFTHFL